MTKQNHSAASDELGVTGKHRSLLRRMMARGNQILLWLASVTALLSNLRGLVGGAAQVPILGIAPPRVPVVGAPGIVLIVGFVLWRITSLFRRKRSADRAGAHLDQQAQPTGPHRRRHALGHVVGDRRHISRLSGQHRRRTVHKATFLRSDRIV
jgi:hypothetical protein